jgi:hypothetical protein
MLKSNPQLYGSTMWAQGDVTDKGNKGRLEQGEKRGKGDADTN